MSCSECYSKKRKFGLLSTWRSRSNMSKMYSNSRNRGSKVLKQAHSKECAQRRIVCFEERNLHTYACETYEKLHPNAVLRGSTTCAQLTSSMRSCTLICVNSKRRYIHMPFLREATALLSRRRNRSRNAWRPANTQEQLTILFQPLTIFPSSTVLQITPWKKRVVT